MSLVELEKVQQKLKAEIQHRVAAQEKAEQANNLKDEFLANMSHEIRTPMNAIVGLGDLLAESRLSARQREYLTAMQTCSASLLKLLNDILDLSKIEAQKLSLTNKPFSLQACLKDLITTEQIIAKKKGLTLHCEISESIPDQIVGDSLRLHQVLLNLLDNALKFTAHGGVELRIGVASEDADDIELLIEVEDTGIGITPETQQFIFGSFNQEDGSISRQYGGTGLGLSIANRLVHLMGGQLRIESVKGQGSTFSFNARFGRHADNMESVVELPTAPAKEVNTCPARASLHILVVEDNAINQRIATEIL